MTCQGYPLFRTCGQRGLPFELCCRACQDREHCPRCNRPRDPRLCDGSC